MSSIRKLLAGVAVALAISSPAFAFSGSWNNETAEPDIYQTNFWNGPNTITSLVSSSSAIITNISFSWAYTYTFNSLNPTYTISGAACYNQVSTNCKIGAGAVTGGSVNNDTSFAGQPANKPFGVYTNAVSSTTKTFAARPLQSSTFKLTVNYTQ